MENLLDKEYLHNGTGEIYRELWGNIYTISNYLKPLGGFWTIPYSEEYFSDWMDYLYDTDKTRFDIARNKENVLVRLKNNTKLLIVNDKNDYKNLKDSGLIITLDKPIRKLVGYNYVDIYEMLDYESISKIYDALYINPWINNSLYSYSVKTMLIMNPDIIDYYKKVLINYDIEDSTLLDIEDKRKINDLDNNYMKLYKYVNKLFNDIIKEYNINDEYDIEIFKKTLLKSIINNDTMTNLINEKLNKEYVLKVMINNIIINYKNNRTKKLIKNKFTL